MHEIKYARHDLAIKVAKCKIGGAAAVYSLHPTYNVGCALVGCALVGCALVGCALVCLGVPW